MKLNNLNVYLEDGEMRLTFSIDSTEMSQETFFQTFIQTSIQEEDGWYDVHRYFAVKQEKDKILVKEKNNEPGNYGQRVVLSIFPAELQRQGFIPAEESLRLIKIISESAAAVERDQAILPSDSLRARK